MKGVPGVIALESQASLASDVISLPIARIQSERTSVLWGKIIYLSTLPQLLNVHHIFHVPPGQSGIVGTVVGSSSLEGRHHLRETVCV